VGGGLSLLTGAVVLARPNALTPLLGAWMIILGGVQLTQANTGKDRKRRRRLLIAASGLLYTIVGAVCLRDLFATADLLAAIIGLVWTIGGATAIVWRSGRSVPVGIATAAAGGLALLRPELTPMTAGAWLVSLGLISVAASFAPGAAR
jgi:hypothetical protein